jgi:hypothetical protein
MLPQWQGDAEHTLIRGLGTQNAVVVDDPQASAQALIGKLQAAGVNADLRREAASVVVVAPASLEALEALEQLNFRAQRAGSRLEVTFVKR